jgi:hypothetical protein
MGSACEGLGILRTLSLAATPFYQHACHRTQRRECKKSLRSQLNSLSLHLTPVTITDHSRKTLNRERRKNCVNGM